VSRRAPFRKNAAVFTGLALAVVALMVAAGGSVLRRRFAVVKEPASVTSRPLAFAAPPPVRVVQGGPPDAALFALPLHVAVVRCESPDAVDDYRFDVMTTTEPASLDLSVAEAADALPEHTRVSFTANSLEDAHGIVTFAQTNDVSHEHDARREWDGKLTRHLTLDDSSPPFLASRRLLHEADTGGIERLWFGSSAQPMPRLVRDGEKDVTVTVRGRAMVLHAERYASPKEAWPDLAELLLVRHVEGLGDLPLVASVARDDLWRVTLLSID
jgi:hypothetical protein